VDVVVEDEEGEEEDVKTSSMSLDMITLKWVRLMKQFALSVRMRSTP